MNLSMLKSIYLFSDLSDSELAKVASVAEEKVIMQGQDLFSRGEEAKSFYVMLMGSVKIAVNSQAGDEIQIRKLGSGSHFGEMPFLDGEKRSATVQAMESSTVLEFSYAKMLSLFEKDVVLANKFYRSAARYLAIRLRATTTDLNEIKELKFQH
jgi:CRP-like cAMP-binding protein